MQFKEDLRKLNELKEAIRLFSIIKDVRTKALLVAYAQNLIRKIYQGGEIQ